MLRTVIFDFDGVIADSELLHFKAFNEALVSYGVEISKQQYFQDYLGLTDTDLFELLIEKGLLKAGKDQIPILAEEKKHCFEKFAQNDAVIIDGVAEFLNLLQENNIPIAICSGALLVEIETILKKSNLTANFETIVSAEQVEKNKPAPDGFLMALERLNQNHIPAIEPTECIVIEDSHWGLEAANAAGMKAVAVTNSYAADELKPYDAVVENLSELTIEQLKNICS